MNCTRCQGFLMADEDGLYCANCGDRPNAKLPPDVERALRMEHAATYAPRKRQPMWRGMAL